MGRNAEGEDWFSSASAGREAVNKKRRMFGQALTAWTVKFHLWCYLKAEKLRP